MKKLLAILITGVIILSCGEPDGVHGNTYNNNEIGWKIEIPKDWNVTVEDSVEVIVGQREDVDEERTLNHLVGFEEDQFNFFRSTVEPFEIEYEGAWEDNVHLKQKDLLDFFMYHDVKLDTSSFTEKIDELEFDVFYINFSRLFGDVVFHQYIYSRYINGFSFETKITYNDEQAKETMMDVWKNSKFKK